MTHSPSPNSYLFRRFEPRLLGLLMAGALLIGWALPASASEAPAVQDEAAGPDATEERQMLPEFKVLDELKVAVPSSRFADKVLLLDFWASWCRPCHFTLPELQRLHEEYGERDDFMVLGLAIDEGHGGGIRARRFAQGAGVTYAIFHDFSSLQAKSQLDVEAVPVLFLVAADGEILRRWDGEPDFSEVEAELKKALQIED